MCRRENRTPLVDNEDNNHIALDLPSMTKIASKIAGVSVCKKRARLHAINCQSLNFTVTDTPKSIFTNV